MPLSKIEWTEVTWNPTTGCNKVSAGCKNCYAESFSKRLKGMGIDKYKNGFKLTLHPDVLDFPKRLRKPHKIFVNSMSDLFHEKIPLEFIQKVFKVMSDCPQHIFQVLTKRAERLEELSPFLNWTDNIWMGVSVEDEKVQHRIDNLVKTNAKIKFLSLEPLLGPLPKLKLKKIDWVIVGGESGRKSRKIEKDWVEDIHKQCEKNNVAFFFKQWGGMNKKANGRELNGRTYDEMPNVA
ncbi:MAG: phage Gp37/Gp68 family protein [Ignavibacteriae bacterium]|nr:phage Gp37/Gp68 family protein [Ignavibacteriota bacterium]